MGGPFFNYFYDSLVCNSVLTKNIFENEYFCQFLASSAKQTKNNFTVRKSYKTRKSAKTPLSNFGFIEETMDLSRIQCNAVRMYFEKSWKAIGIEKWWDLKTLRMYQRIFYSILLTHFSANLASIVQHFRQFVQLWISRFESERKKHGDFSLIMF